MAHKDEEIRQIVERLQRLEENQERQTRERRWESRRATRHNMRYRSQEQDWIVHNFEERRHQHHQQPNNSFYFVTSLSFSGENDPNFYLE